MPSFLIAVNSRCIVLSDTLSFLDISIRVVSGDVHINSSIVICLSDNSFRTSFWTSFRTSFRTSGMLLPISRELSVVFSLAAMSAMTLPAAVDIFLPMCRLSSRHPDVRVLR